MLVKCILLLMPCHFHFQSACWCFSIELLMELVCFRNFSCPPSVPKEACTCEISVSHDAVFVAGNPPPPHLWHSPSLNYNPCKIRFLSSSYISLQISATLSISFSLTLRLSHSISLLTSHSVSLSLTHSPSLFLSPSLFILVTLCG